MRTAENGGAAGLRVVVLGGTGFLGRGIGEAFTEDGAQVHLVSRQPAQDALAGPRSVRMDLLTAEPRELAEFFGSVRPDVVVNAAGRAWRADETEMTAGNADLVARVTESLVDLPRPCRLIQLGTVHEYGAGTPGVGTTEDHEPAPVTPYGRTKLLGSRIVLKAAADHGLDGVVLRLANVIGAGAPAGSLFGKVAAHLGEAARAQLRGEKPDELRLPPLRAHRDIVDAYDAVDAVRAAATAPGADLGGQVVNIARGEAIAMDALIHRMVELSGVDLPVAGAGADAVAGQPSRTDAEWQQLDVSRALRLLGWQPRRTLDASLHDLLAAVMPAPANGRT
ncbi:NAD-dependent epimerase/dehydratase family protein [Streptomyces sp. MnatMP-M17]|uniref:NAD-dependent epimerase/dehydratase family protein n=1 Tax=unclassified Streptomyces TaxID=2593676 RepID=UPI00081F2CBB|nr:NAD-dependent epimerase/dehydratase family protein [Streptomyces sp. MnatMP-M17]MYZ36953.1 NAD-dependent epimerase/dehydratase family protein [Streptomyces sp. SID4917]SCF87530.1 Nucleoside-diphosphate-sugar epimerase [Streptomyces sp. MnatMP-M17]